MHTITYSQTHIALHTPHYNLYTTLSLTHAYIQACSGRYEPKLFDALIGLAEAVIQKDEKATAFLADNGISWQNVQKDVRKGIKDWYNYKIATN